MMRTKHPNAYAPDRDERKDRAAKNICSPY